MIKKSSTFVSGVVAVGIYIFVIALLLFYFNTRKSNKSIHYVEKNEKRIRVSVSTPKNTSKRKKHKSPTTKSSKKSIKKKKSTHKKVIKEKIVKKKVLKKNPKVIKKKPQKKVNKPKSLFDSVVTKKKPEKKNIIKVTNTPIKPKKNNPIKVSDKLSASDMVSSPLKVQDVSDSGIKDSYMAHIERLIYEFPAESDYAGEEIKVSLHIERDGSFTFRLISISANNDFNQEFEAYLKQLQSIGFGTHKGNRAYDVDVEFIATE